MLLSKKLLENFFPVFKKIKESDIEKTLLLMGCEIESKKTFNNIDNLIVGLITETKKHPKSNKLNLCTVLVNNKERTIVCGADNVRPNAKVIVALENAHMVDGRIIQYKELLGIVSEGMICAYNELTPYTEFISEPDKDNIIILDDNAKLNDTNPLKYIHFDDVIYDISIPSNRNELNGVIGIAHDLLHILKPDYEFDYDFDFSKIKKNKIKLDIDKENAEFFGTIEMKNMKPTESSWTVKAYLMNSGIRPINSIVDISNLVMVLSGAPTHSYDKNKIGNTFSLSSTKSPKKIVALDKKEYEIPKDSILVNTDNKPACLGGIIGFDSTSINDDTTDVVFEVANFDNKKIYKSSRTMNLRTDASILNSKRIPLWIRVKSFEIMINLLMSSKSEFNGISYTPFKIKETKIPFDFKRIDELLGATLSKEDIEKKLTHLGFKIEKNNLIPPVYREDILNLYDVTEELLKLIDVNKLVLKPIENTYIDINVDNFEHKNIIKTNNYFINHGYSLVKTYNLTSNEFNQKFNIFGSNKLYEIINPISKDRKYLRSSIVGQLFNVYVYNNSYKNELIPIFELQKLNYDKKEHYHLSLLLNESIYKNDINKSLLKTDLFYLKSILVDYFNSFNYQISFSDQFEVNSNAFIKSNALAIIDKNNKVIGYMGQINPNYCKENKIDQTLYFVEIIVDQIIKNKINIDFVINKINSTTHDIVRSLSFVLENQKITDLLKAFDNNNDIESYKIKDVFKIDENQVSYNFEFIIKKTDEKLSQEQINEIFNRIINYFEKESFKIKK